MMGLRRKSPGSLRIIDICHSKLTIPQLRAIEKLFSGTPNPYYKECKKIVKSILTIEVNHDLTKDKWAIGMRDHYKEVMRIMDSFYRLAQDTLTDNKPFKLRTWHHAETPTRNRS